MASPVGTAFIAVRPDLTGFSNQIKVDLKKAIAELPLSARTIQLNPTITKKALTEAIAAMGPIPVVVAPVAPKGTAAELAKQIGVVSVPVVFEGAKGAKVPAGGTSTAASAPVIAQPKVDTAAAKTALTSDMASLGPIPFFAKPFIADDEAARKSLISDLVRLGPLPFFATPKIHEKTAIDQLTIQLAKINPPLEVIPFINAAEAKVKLERELAVLATSLPVQPIATPAALPKGKAKATTAAGAVVEVTPTIDPVAAKASLEQDLLKLGVIPFRAEPVVLANSKTLLAEQLAAQGAIPVVIAPEVTPATKGKAVKAAAATVVEVTPTLAGNAKAILQEQVANLKEIFFVAGPALIGEAKALLTEQLVKVGPVPFAAVPIVDGAQVASQIKSQVGAVAVPVAAAAGGVAAPAAKRASRAAGATVDQGDLSLRVLKVTEDLRVATTELTTAEGLLTEALATQKVTRAELEAAEASGNKNRIRGAANTNAEADKAVTAATKQAEALRIVDAEAKVAAANLERLASVQNVVNLSLSESQAVTIGAANAEDLLRKNKVATNVVNKAYAAAVAAENAPLAQQIELQRSLLVAEEARIEGTAGLIAAQGLGAGIGVGSEALGPLAKAELTFEQASRASTAAIEAQNIALKSRDAELIRSTEALASHTAALASDAGAEVLRLEAEKARVPVTTRLAQIDAAVLQASDAQLTSAARVTAAGRAHTLAAEGVVKYGTAVSGATAKDIERLVALEASTAGLLQDTKATNANAIAAARNAKAVASEAAARNTLTAQAVRGTAATGATFLGLRGAVLSASTGFLAATVAVTGLAKIVKTAEDLQRQLNIFQSVSGATAAQMALVSEKAKQLGADLSLPATSATDAAEAMTELQKAGLSVIDTLGASKGVLQLSAAADISNVDAAQIVATQLNAFKLAGSEAGRVVDLLAGASIAAQGEITDFSLAFQQVAAVAEQVGLPVEKATAILTQFAKAGIRGCYDNKTDVLTRAGWKPWAAVTMEDEFATVNPDTGHMEYQLPERLVRYQHTGKMYEVRNDHVDLCVTPDHRMWVKRGNHNHAEFQVMTAEEVYGKSVRYQAAVGWVGDDNPVVVLPGFDQPRGRWTKKIADRSIAAEDWAAFMGYYLSEGSSDYNRGSYRISIAQRPGKKKKKMLADILRMGFKVTENKRALTICSEQLYRSVCNIGHTAEKRVPREILEWSPRLLRIFHEAFRLGDGDNEGRLYTSSLGLRDDLTEVILKCGWATKHRLRMPVGKQSTMGDGRVLTARHEGWSVSTNKSQMHPEFDNTPSHVARREGSTRVYERWVDYDGEVFCATVPNHLLVVRRNGNVVVSGNSDAGTSLRTLLLRLVPTTKAAADAQAELGISLDKSLPVGQQFNNLVDQYTAALAKLGPVAQQESLTKIFGQDAIRGASISLTSGSQALADIEAAVTKSGSAAELTRGRTEGLTGSVEGLKSNVSTLSATIGQQLLPTLDSLAHTFSSIATNANTVLGVVTKISDITIKPLGNLLGGTDALAQGGVALAAALGARKLIRDRVDKAAVAKIDQSVLALKLRMTELGVSEEQVSKLFLTMGITAEEANVRAARAQGVLNKEIATTAELQAGVIRLQETLATNASLSRFIGGSEIIDTTPNSAKVKAAAEANSAAQIGAIEKVNIAAEKSSEIQAAGVAKVTTALEAETVALGVVATEWGVVAAAEGGAAAAGVGAAGAGAVGAAGRLGKISGRLGKFGKFFGPGKISGVGLTAGIAASIAGNAIGGTGGDALGAAGTGATFGSFLGIEGAAVGAAAFGGFSLIKSFNEANKKRQEKLKEEFRKMDPTAQRALIEKLFPSPSAKANTAQSALEQLLQRERPDPLNSRRRGPAETQTAAQFVAASGGLSPELQKQLDAARKRQAELAPFAQSFLPLPKLGDFKPVQGSPFSQQLGQPSILDQTFNTQALEKQNAEVKKFLKMVDVNAKLRAEVKIAEAEAAGNTAGVVAGQKELLAVEKKAAAAIEQSLDAVNFPGGGFKIKGKERVKLTQELITLYGEIAGLNKDLAAAAEKAFEIPASVTVAGIKAGTTKTLADDLANKEDIATLTLKALQNSLKGKDKARQDDLKIKSAQANADVVTTQRQIADQNVANAETEIRIAADAAGNIGAAENKLIAFLKKQANDSSKTTAEQLAAQQALTSEIKKRQASLAEIVNATVGLRDAKLQTRLALAELTATDKDNIAVFNAQIANDRKDILRLQKLADSSSTTAQQRIDYLTQIQGELQDIARLEGQIKSAQGGSGFSIEDLFKEALNQFNQFASNVSTSVTTPGGVRGAIGGAIAAQNPNLSKADSLKIAAATTTNDLLGQILGAVQGNGSGEDSSRRRHMTDERDVRSSRGGVGHWTKAQAQAFAKVRSN